MIHNFIIPIIVVLAIFIIAQMVKSNFDLKELDKHTATTIIIDKKVKPPGTTPMYRAIGGQIRAIPITNEEEPTLYVTINNRKTSAIVDKQLYEEVVTGDKIQVVYLAPKYWGNPIIISVYKRGQ